MKSMVSRVILPIRDVYQKDSIKSVLEEHCNDDDIILWSDLDEVPNPNVRRNLKTFYQPGCVYNFTQDNYQASLNWFETTELSSPKLPTLDMGQRVLGG